MLLTKNVLIFLTIMRANLDFGKIQTFYTKYRPNKDPFCSKGLYYRPRSLNKDPAGSTGAGGNDDDEVEDVSKASKLSAGATILRGP